MKNENDKQRSIRDLLPEESKKFRKIRDVCEKIAYLYGYEEYNPSIMENFSTFDKKSSREILDEQTYHFTDRGNTDVLIRPEITPSLARIVDTLHSKREFKAPLRWYTIGPVFRYEKPQKGRKRTHYQFNIDLLGVPDLWADIEIMKIAGEVLLNLGLNKNDFTIIVNDKSNLEGLLVGFGYSSEELVPLFRNLDKGKNADDKLTKCIEKIQNEKPDTVKNIEKELTEFNIKYDASLVRGFDYYTGIIFEIFPTTEKESRSLIGGGRYDKFISNGTIPACGFGMGDVRILDLLEEKNKFENINTKVGIAVYGDKYFTKIQGDILGKLRDNSIPSALIPEQKKLSEFYKLSEIKNFKYSLLINELGEFVLRDLEMRTNSKFNSIGELINTLI